MYFDQNFQLIFQKSLTSNVFLDPKEETNISAKKAKLMWGYCRNIYSKTKKLLYGYCRKDS